MPHSPSSDSLPMSARSRGSIYTNASSVHTLSADTDGLHRLLATRDLTTHVIAGAFEEYAWRGVLRGTRVRDWCEGLRTLLDELHIVEELHIALQTPAFATLFPFLSLITGPNGCEAHFIYPPPTLPADQLTSLDSDTLVDTVLSLLEGSEIVSPDDLAAPVTELVLEYIGAVWRQMASDEITGLSAADGVAKALVELEFEVSHPLLWANYADDQMQCQGTHSILRTLIFPIVRRIRFSIGFVTSFQLVSRLKSLIGRFNQMPSRHAPHHLIEAWALRRLNSGMSPQKVYDELVFIRERVRDEAIQDVVEAVSKQLGLEKKDTQDQDDSPGSPSFSFPRVSPPTPSKVFGFFSSKKAARKTMEPPRKGPSGFLFPAGFNPDRRPSLPVTPSQVPHRLVISSPLTSSSLTSFQSSDSFDLIIAQSQPHVAELLSQIMTFSEASDVRLILLDYIVESRYRLHSGGGADWYFGSGRESAASTLDTLEGRLVGKRDVMDLAAVFGEIRTQFDIPPPGSPIRIGIRERRKLINPPFVDTTRQMYHQDVPQDIVESRGVSFDIDSYYHRHITEEDEFELELEREERTVESRGSSSETVKARRKSTGASSQFSLSSNLSTNTDALTIPATDNRSSLFSTYTFSIREAKIGTIDQGHLHASQSDDSLASPSQTSPLGMFFPSRSESSLHDAYALPSPGARYRIDRMQSSSGGHLGIPRSSSPAGSFHSLLSALDLETRIPADLLDRFPDPSTLSPPTTPPDTATPASDRARRKQNRQCVVVDNLELSPDRHYQDFPEEVATPTLEPTRRRYTSAPGASVSTLNSIDESVPTQPGDLPLAQLLALFTGQTGAVGGAREGTTPADVARAATAFVYGEMQYADELGSGWDAEDQRRVIWLLRQIAALMPNPDLQYPIHQQIQYLERHSPNSMSSRTSLASSTSTSTSTSTNRFLATPAHKPRRSFPPPTVSMGSVLSTPVEEQTLGVTLGPARDSVQSAHTFGVAMGRKGQEVDGRTFV